MADYKNFKDAADLLFKDIFPTKGEINESNSMFKVKNLQKYSQIFIIFRSSLKLIIQVFIIRVF